MRIIISFMQRYAKGLIAIALILSLFWFTKLPALSATERALLASHFNFTRLALPQLAGHSPRLVRTVHPSLEVHSAWISAVGASVALNDLDGDGLSNDVCYVDTRTDQVIVAPVPGTPVRYEPFGLEPVALPYDAATMAPMGCLPGDLNEDGLMDILVYYWGRTPIAFLKTASEDISESRNLTPQQSSLPGKGESDSPLLGEGFNLISPRASAFVETRNLPSLHSNSYVQQETIPGEERWYTNAATLADLDGDGHPDLVIGNYFQDNAQILNANATGVEFMQHSMTRAANGGRNRLLLWRGATTGKEPTVQFQEAKGVLDESIARAWTLAVGAADLDGDLLPELYFANDFGSDHLLHNRSQPGKLQFALLEGKKTLTTPNSKVLGHDGFKGMGVDFGDVNSDGLLDIYVSNIAAEYALEESHFLFVSTGERERMKEGIAPYVDRSEPLGVSRSGWGWETKFGDFDNDGGLEALQATGFAKGEVNRWPELHELAMGNDELLSKSGIWPRFQPGDDLSGHQHNPFFVRASNGRYYDLAQEVGLDETPVSRGIATADVDGDGDLDFAVANQWEPSYFYRNDSQKPGAFLGLHVLRSQNSHSESIQNPKSQIPNSLGSPAVGAAATVHLPDGRQLVAQVDGGNGHSGARSPDLHFGVGQISENTPLQVELKWRDVGGQVHQESLHLSPGWHTVLLGDSAKTNG
jgi:hypothetical protein